MLLTGTFGAVAGRSGTSFTQNSMGTNIRSSSLVFIPAALNVSRIIAWAVTWVRWAKIRLKYICHSFSQQGIGALLGICFLRLFRFVLEKWQWSKDLGFSSVGLNLEFCSLLELSSDRNAVCIFISSSLALLSFSSHSSPFFLFFPSLFSSSLTFFPVSSELKIPPASWWNSKRMKTGEFWILNKTVN